MGEEKPIIIFQEKIRNIWEHVNDQFNYDAIAKNGWGIENHSYDDSDTINCLEMDYVNFLIDEESRKIETKEHSLMADGNETIDIDISICSEVTQYDITDKYQDLVFILRILIINLLIL